VGGSARTWSTTLAENLAAGGALELRVVMTKFDVPAVTIGYQVVLEFSG
jgi:hypothetical protein